MRLLTRRLVARCYTRVTYSTTYRYTLDNCLLSDQQREQYEEQGYLVIPRLVPRETLDIYRQRFTKICRENINIRGMMVARDISLAKSNIPRTEENVSKIQDFRLDEVLYGYTVLPELLKYVECFVGRNIMVIRNMILNKPPDTGSKTSRHPLHQDMYYFPLEPSERIVGCWTAMQTVNRENGCLTVIPGSHKGPIQEHDYPDWEGGVNWAYLGIKGYNPSQPLTYLCMEAGDTLFFNPALIHGSGRNMTQKTRMAIACHFASSSCEYVNLENNKVEQLTEELLRKRTGKTYNLIDLLKKKVYLVQGERQNL